MPPRGSPDGFRSTVAAPAIAGGAAAEVCAASALVPEQRGEDLELGDRVKRGEHADGPGKRKRGRCIDLRRLAPRIMVLPTLFCDR
jgi:hypothetical protein